MIWITGDKHGQIEAFEENPNARKIKKRDTLIICGDFGFVWDNSKQERKNLKKLSKKKYTIAFIDGCNENFSILNEYPLNEWNGGQVRKISKNIFWLQRGECYNIEDKKVLVFGGGDSPNYELQTDNLSNSSNPTKKDYENLRNTIEKNNGEFDIIVSHEPPLSIKYCFENDKNQPTDTNHILEEIKTNSNIKKWYFGYEHADKFIPPLYRAVFNDFVKVD